LEYDLKFFFKKIEQVEIGVISDSIFKNSVFKKKKNQKAFCNLKQQKDNLN
jgi:hypothetical protein